MNLKNILSCAFDAVRLVEIEFLEEIMSGNSTNRAVVIENEFLGFGNHKDTAIP